MGTGTGPKPEKSTYEYGYRSGAMGTGTSTEIGTRVRVVGYGYEYGYYKSAEGCTVYFCVQINGKTISQYILSLVLIRLYSIYTGNLNSMNTAAQQRDERPRTPLCDKLSRVRDTEVNPTMPTHL